MFKGNDTPKWIMPSKRNLIIAFSATAFAGIAVLGYWTTTPSYALVDIGYINKNVSKRVDSNKIAAQ